MKQSIVMWSAAVVLACGGSGESTSGGTGGTAGAAGTGGTAGTGVGGTAGRASGGGSGGGAAGTPTTLDPAWQAVADALGQSDIADLALVVGDDSGVRFRQTKGDFSFEARYPIASASKWLTSATVLRLVERGVLDLDQPVSSYASWWTADASDPRSEITARQLLAFTSGYAGTPVGALSPPCVRDTTLTIDACARSIYADWFVYEPGTTFYYGPSHMQLLAGVLEDSLGTAWATIFEDELAGPLGLSATAYESPSTTNPRISGGVVSTVDDYATFLAAVHAGDLWPTTRTDMLSDNTPSATVTLEFTPLDSTGYEFHYALGTWRECLAPTWQPSCDTEIVASSTGAFGWHPWIDVGNDYWGVLAMQLPFGGTPSSADRSIALAVSLRPLIVSALARP